MKKSEPSNLRSALITLGLLALAFMISLVVDSLFEAQPLIPLFFVLAVFWVSQLTEGYFWGIFSSLFSVLAVNFVFTYPFFAFDFEVVENLVSAIIIMVVSISTCTLTQKMRRHEMLKSEFDRENMRANLLRGVSHDLRTPLTAIYGASSTIYENYDLLSDEDKKQMLKGIGEDSQWLISMVENLLSITKIGSENVKLSKVPVVVEELLGSALSKFQRRYPQEKVELILPPALIIVSADPLLLQQVLVNLLENAVQHGEGLQTITLSVALKENTVVFSVEDDGCGIPKEKLGKLFSGTLSQGSSPDQKKRNMGIGLSVCATIVKAHGGEIRAENRNPRGMRFSFTLEAEEIIYE